MKTKQFNLDNEEDFFKSDLGKMFQLIFKNNKEATLAYKLLQLIKEERHGIRVYGNTYKICEQLNISYPYLIKLLRIIENLGFIEYVKYSVPVIITQTLKKEDTKLTDDIVMHYEKRQRSAFIVLSNSVKFVKFLSSSARDWIRFRKISSLFGLSEEESEKNE